MKRIVLTMTAVILSFMVEMSAQTRFGIIGGVGFNKGRLSEVVVDRTPAGWNGGVTLSIDLPAGFTIQPTLCYHQKEAMLLGPVSQKMGFVELPLSFQWGPDLMLFRPLVDVTPFVGYAVSNSIAGTTKTVSFDLRSWEGKQRFEYGLGIGGGIEVWRFQLICRYNWNFGPLYNVDGWRVIKDNLGNLNIDSKNFEGITLSLAVFF